MKDFSQVIEHLSERAEQAPHMVQAMIELTYGCNLRCVHCYNPTHQARNELTEKEICGLLDQLADQGCLWVGFTGGELFTRKDALTIMRHARSRGIVVSILTNATLISSGLADQIQALEPFQLDISVYGATAATYEKVTGVPGSFQQFVKGVDRLMERRLPVFLKLIMMTLNIHELALMRQFAESRGLPYRVDSEIHPRVDGSREPLAYRLSPKQSFELWRQESARGKPDPSAAPQNSCGSAGRLFECMCGKSNAAVTPHGKLNLCLSIYHPLLDLKEISLAEGWKKLVHLVASARPGLTYECERCDVAVHCTRGSSDGWLEQKAFDAPCLPHFKEVAEMKSQYLERRSPIHGKNRT